MTSNYESNRLLSFIEDFPYSREKEKKRSKTQKIKILYFI
jgi:hypothetical protein